MDLLVLVFFVLVIFLLLLLVLVFFRDELVLQLLEDIEQELRGADAEIAELDRAVELDGQVDLGCGIVAVEAVEELGEHVIVHASHRRDLLVAVLHEPGCPHALHAAPELGYLVVSEAIRQRSNLDLSHCFFVLGVWGKSVKGAGVPFHGCGSLAKARATVARMNVMARILGTLPLWVCATVVLAAPGSPTESLIDAGSQLIEAENYAAALDKLDRAARLDPKDPRPRYLAAVAWEKKGDLPKAEKGFRDALALDPKLADVRGELGALLQDLGRSDEAVVELKKAVQLQPDLGDAWFNLGQAELKRRHCEQAEVAFGRAAALKAGDPDPLIQRTVALRECKKIDEAVKTARQAVKGAPSSAPAQVNLGLALEAQGKVDDARAALTAATRLKGDYATGWWSLGLLELHAKRPTEAKAAFERSRTLAPTAAHIADLGRAWRDLGDFAKAETSFKEALAKDAKFGPGHFYLAQLYAASGRCGEMVTELEQSQVPADKAKSVRASCKGKK